MKMLVRCSLLLFCGFTAFAQAPAELIDKAPPPVDEALRARIAQFYGAFIEGKFKDAYLLVADESQDRFFEVPKSQYKSCEVAKLAYTDNFTKATVVESCKTDWHWHGVVTPTTFPITSNWKVVDGQWYWTYVKPTMVPSPFSPTGMIPVPPDAGQTPADKAPAIPTDMRAMAQRILNNVAIDKQVVHLKRDETSRDTIHVTNKMPGAISLSVDDLSATPGLKASLTKTKLAANEEADLVFEYRLEDPAIACIDCAKKISAPRTTKLKVQPTGQIFTVAVVFDPPAPVPSAPPSAAKQ